MMMKFALPQASHVSLQHMGRLKKSVQQLEDVYAWQRSWLKRNVVAVTTLPAILIMH